MATDGSRIHDTQQHDGKTLCAICAHDAPDDGAVWCELTGSFICRSCCHGVSVLEPRLIVEAMARAQRPLSPTEMASVCFACATRCAPGAAAFDLEIGTRPS